MHCRRNVVSTVFALGLLAALLACQSGCVNAIAGTLWVLRGNNVKPEFTKLKGKRIAIVCRPVVELQYATATVSSELADTLGVLLQQKVRNVEIVDPQDVAQWTDEHEWEDYAEIGEALDADMIVGIDLVNFTIYQGQTLYQGSAQATIKVYDIADKSKVVFQKSLPRTQYPPNTGIPTAELPEDEFRRKFVTVLADTIGRYFYEHPSDLSFAEDTRSL